MTFYIIEKGIDGNTLEVTTSAAQGTLIGEFETQQEAVAEIYREYPVAREQSPCGEAVAVFKKGYTPLTREETKEWLSDLLFYFYIEEEGEEFILSDEELSKYVQEYEGLANADGFTLTTTV